MRNIVIGILFLSILLSCNNGEKANDKALGLDTSGENTVHIIKIAENDTARLNILHDSLFWLPEVQKIHKSILAATAHKHGVSMIDYPIKDSAGQYEIGVGFNGDIRFETQLHFFVNVKTLEIKIEDLETGERLGIEEYRKLHKPSEGAGAKVR